MMYKGMREEFYNKNFLVIVPCNDGEWVYGTSDDIDEAWEIAFQYRGAWVKIND